MVVALVLLAATTQGALPADLDTEGRAAYGRGDYVTAERLFAEAVARDPRDPRARYHHAVALTQLGRWAEAERQHAHVLQLGPSPQLAAASREALQQLRTLARSRPTRARQDTDETTVALEALGGGWVATVVLNDSRRARFLVDTGAAITVISPALARALRIEAPSDAPSVRLQTLSGKTSAPVVSIPSLRVGDMEARDTPAVIHAIEMGIDGILGNTFLRRYTVTLDARNGILRMRNR